MSVWDTLFSSSSSNSTADLTLDSFIKPLLSGGGLGILKDLAVPLTLLAAVFSQVINGFTSLQGLWDSVLVSFCSTLVIDEYEEAYDQLYAWAAEQYFTKTLRHLRFASDDEDDRRKASKITDPSSDEIFNYQSWEAMSEPRFEPETSTGWFNHNGYWFSISRSQEKAAQAGRYQSPREKVTIKVYSWSTKPIQDLLREIRHHHYAKQKSTTVVRRPVPDGREFSWKRIAERPSRPMHTVALEEEQKRALLEDVNSFLHPRHQQWYSNRGIPYRRGYLLYGPPGTGKSSMSFALAGLFGLAVYCISLSDPALSETNLIQLFNHLPRRCLVLLEDVDSAGLGKRQQEAGETKSKSEMVEEVSKTACTTCTQKQDDTKPATKQRKSKKKDKIKGITLSGLLNAIDGVAAAEGRLLVMTTNHPENLDDALIRPGRVDMQIEFGLATTAQIRQIFLRMYRADTTEEIRQPRTITEALAEPQSFTTGPNLPEAASKLDPQTGADDLETLADTFASRIPNAVFSPAAVQGFLIAKRKSALQAVLDAEAWVAGEQSKKISGGVVEAKKLNPLIGLPETLDRGSTSVSEDEDDSGSDSGRSTDSSDASDSDADD